MSISIRAASSPGEVQVAMVQDNHLIDYTLWRPGSPDGVGDVHRGRIIAAVPGMAGAFVAIAGAEGFLPDSEGAKGRTEGSIVIVRVTRAAQGNKGPRLTARVDQTAASGPVALLHRGPDPVTRFASRFPDAQVLVDDPALAATLALPGRVTVSTPVFDEELADSIDALARPLVTLPNGASISFTPTPALVAIDVDAGGSLNSGRARHDAVNRALLPVLAEQIRLRNLSGAIVVDLAGLSPRKRAALAPDFITALAHDPLHPKFLGFTALGLAEIVRPRIHPPLHEMLRGPLATGLASLRAVLAEFNGNPRVLPSVRVHPAVVTALKADTVALPDFARRTGCAVSLRSDPSLPPEVAKLEKDHA